MSQLFPIDQVRARFPALQANKSAVFLDNPAGTQVPGEVIDAVSDCYRDAFANLGGSFRTSLAADEIIVRTHRLAAAFCGAASEREIAIGASMTELTYQLARVMARGWQAGDELVVTTMDHEGNVSPWLQVASDFGLTVREVRFDATSWRIEPEPFKAALSERTKLVALNYASNLSGAINDVKGLTAIAKKAGALVYVDAVQFAPHDLIDVAALSCDVLVCSAYKFFGPHISLLWGREDLLDSLAAERLRCGPTGPGEKFERGTPQIELQAGLAGAIDYLCWLGREVGGDGSPREALAAAFAAARDYEADLARRLIEGLTGLPGITVQGPTDLQRMDLRVPTISFTSDRISNRQLAAGLAEQDIYAWSGHNYAYGIAQQLGLDMEDGVLRLGIAHYNTDEEIARTLEAVAALTK